MQDIYALQNLRDLEYGPSRSLGVKSNNTFGLLKPDFVLVLTANISSISTHLRDTGLENIGDINFDI